MKRLALLLLLALPLPAFAAPPKLVIGPVIPATSDYVIVVPDTDAKAITYVGFQVDPFPSNMLADPRAFCLPVRGLPAGQYHFAAVGSLNDEHTRTDFVVAVGQSPVPPTPTPTPPGPTPDPDPFAKPVPPGATQTAAPVAGGLKVLIVVETSDLSKLPASQVTILTSSVIREYLNAHCITDGTQKAWRIWDKDVTTTAESSLWQRAFAKVPKDKVPWLMVGDGARGYSGPLPVSVDAFMTLLGKFGG